MDPMTTDAVLADLLAIVNRSENPEGYHTVVELSEAAGASTKRVRGWLNRVKAAGRLEVRKVEREALDGSRRWIPGYRIVADPDA